MALGSKKIVERSGKQSGAIARDIAVAICIDAEQKTPFSRNRADGLKRHTPATIPERHMKAPMRPAHVIKALQNGPWRREGCGVRPVQHGAPEGPKAAAAICFHDQFACILGHVVVGAGRIAYRNAMQRHELTLSLLQVHW